MHPEEPTQLVPRMGLKHLMLWMFVTAAIIGWAMNNFVTRGTPGDARSLRMIMQLYMSMNAIGMGGLFTVAITLLVACLRHQQIVLFAPGHWIAVALSLGYLWTAVTYLAYWVTSNSLMPDYSSIMLVFSLGGLLQAIVYLGAWRQQSASRWRWLFGWATLTEFGFFIVYAVGALPLMQGYPLPLGAIFSLSKELISLVAIVACIVEVLKGVRRDWAHTVSIVGLFIVSFTSYARLLAVFFIFRL